MQFALVNNLRVEPFVGGKGICPDCKSNMIAKCGPRNIHHWAHFRKKNCDPWWENETQWHRDWKLLFPKECREISYTDEIGEVHRADIRTPTGIFIEIQHSAMTDKERVSREEFYKNIVWIVDGRGFKNNFNIFHELPDPSSKLSLDLVWHKAKSGLRGAEQGSFWRRSENPDADSNSLVFTHGLQEIYEDVKAAYRGHHQFDWIKPRKTWLEAKAPVYIDFGEEFLLRLEKYGDQQLPCIRIISKNKFVHDVMIETSVSQIATKFHPIGSRS